ncbi:MAG: glycosyltransferase [Candidatus Helarchaeota archaeon]|nr:glycosyltransferase [Candidatus Helarchaeota archaeon]
MKKIKFSILIATYNRKDELEKCINSILQVDFPKDEYEILIGDGGSNDSTFEFMKKLVVKSKKFTHEYPFIGYFRESQNLGGMGNRIKPLYSSKGKYICTLDSDATVPKNWLKSIYSLMESENLDVSGGLQLTNPKKGPTFGADLGAHGAGVAPYQVRNPLFLSGVATFFKRSTLIKMGGFDPIMIYGGADLEIGIRARLFGAKVLGDINTIVDHTESPVKDHFRARKNLEKYIYFQLSRHTYLYLKNFEWKYGINLSLRYFLYINYICIRELLKKHVSVIKGYLKGIFWILINLGTIFINHNRVKRNVKSSKIIKKFFHPNPNIFSLFLMKIRKNNELFKY